MRIAVCLGMLLALGAPVAALAKGAPKVIASAPKNGERGVDPALKAISVTFDQPMRDKSWSWVIEDKAKFPELAGDPAFKKNGRTCVLPVRLKPGQEYVVLVNSATHQNFKSKAGTPATPYRLVFRTR